MPTTRTALDLWNRDFLEVRHRVLDIAAALDRCDRADDSAKARSDSRYLQLEQAIRLLVDGRPDRTESIQMTFSEPYDAAWKSSFEIPGK